MGTRRAYGQLALVGLIVAAACGPAANTEVDAGGDPPPDTAVLGNGQFGEACDTHGDCASGICVQPVDEQRGQCTRTCSGDCPTGWDCLDVEFATGNAMVCVPNVARQCLPCVTDSECPGGACLLIDNSGRCEASCATTAQCLPGYECLPDATGTHTGKFCQPTSGSCTCDASHEGEVRTCQNTNAVGVCLGSQTCHAATGWSACTAKTAAVETCNGEDDDCNFIVDNDVGGGEACTNDVAGVGSCPGIRTCDGAAGFSCHGQTPTVEKCNGIDDDCNGQTDETFPNLNTSCSAGTGACQSFGAIACNATQDGTTCTATAGTAGTEACNNVDDDCDGPVDEDFPTLGDQCSAGLGVCQRFGTIECGGAGTQCSATAGMPGAESCNFLDDNCNGFVDDGFLNPATALYDLDVHHCGSCGNDCTTQFNFVNAHGACTASAGVARCTMECDPGTFNLDGFTQNGCYFVLDANGIYVAGDDPTSADDAGCGLGPTGTGGGHPCLTIGQGLARAAATGRTTVYVADALYTESVTLRNGIALRGGFRDGTWQRHVETTNTSILGSMLLGIHAATVVATNISATTVVEGFIIRGSDNALPGGNSYAIYASNSGGLAVRDNQIFAGRGGPGAAGGAGINGPSGTAGGPYSAALYDAYQATGSGFCNSVSNRGAYGAGLLTCPTSNPVGGGNGGGNNCTPSRSTQNSTSVAPATPGSSGAGAGGGVGGAVGARGFDSLLNGTTCFLPNNGAGVLLPQFGADGKAGGAGAPGAAVAGCATTTGTVAGGHWSIGVAPSGVVGFNGGGGGGGGAGGGVFCQSCAASKDQLGGHGGGGGSGGCSGTGGGGGGAGGGSFGIFVVGAAPAIDSNAIRLGTGGNGGSGGVGGAGGLGGVGSAGGNNTNFFCTGKGGRGGDGGVGGAGSGGGGGCGGGAFGIFTSGVGSPAYCLANTLSGGTSALGGSGGSSGGNQGGIGAAGTVQNCLSL